MKLFKVHWRYETLIILLTTKRISQLHKEDKKNDFSRYSILRLNSSDFLFLFKYLKTPYLKPITYIPIFIHILRTLILRCIDTTECKPPVANQHSKSSWPSSNEKRALRDRTVVASGCVSCSSLPRSCVRESIIGSVYQSDDRSASVARGVPLLLRISFSPCRPVPRSGVGNREARTSPMGKRERPSSYDPTTI